MSEIKDQAIALKEQGNVFFAKGDSENAVKSYTEGIKLDAENYQLFSNRAAAYLKLNKLENALTDALKCTELAPDWAKGYTRLAQAQLRMGKLDDCKNTIDQIKNLEPDNRNIKQLQDAVESKKLFKRLKGNWFGKVSPELGGYLQVFDIRSETEAIVSVFGRAIVAKLKLSGSQYPAWLDLLVESEPGQPSAPEVKHILKFVDDDTIVLCSPYMTPPEQRPTKFDGPACVTMKRGLPPVDQNQEAEKKEISSLTATKKCERFALDVIGMLPDHRIAPLPTDSETEQAKIMLENVTFQTAYYDIKEKYGDEIEEYVRFYLEGSVKCPDANLKTLVDTLRKKMQVCGMFPSDEELATLQGEGGLSAPTSTPLSSVMEEIVTPGNEDQKIAKPQLTVTTGKTIDTDKKGNDTPADNTCVMITGFVAVSAALIALIYIQKSN